VNLTDLVRIYRGRTNPFKCIDIVHEVGNYYFIISNISLKIETKVL
jgi:hypothetical protein